MGFILNKGQQNVVDEADYFIKKSSEQVFQFAGNPGTGKSLVLNAIIDRSGIDRNRIAPMSFIGAATIVMRLKGLRNAKTIHSWLLNPTESFKSDNAGNIMNNDYFNRPTRTMEFASKALVDIDLILIDEAGSVPYSLKEEIESRGIKIIATGDLDQLPPVADRPAYLYEGKVHILDEIMRQSKNSGIVYLSQRAKLGLPIHKGYYNNALVIDEDELSLDMIANADIMLCGKNKTRDERNNLVRNEILKTDSTLPMHGEKIVCRRNNWKLEHQGINLANGLVGSISNYPDVSGFDGKSFTIDFMPDMLNSSFRNIQCDYEYFTAPYDKRDKLKYNKYNTAEKFEYAYAITTHMAQGAQYANGIYLEEYLSPTINTNLNYTGITRFSNFVIYVKQKRKFY